MKKIIVTGGSGFIGSNLVNFLIKKKYYVINIDKLTYSSNKYDDSIRNKKNYKFFRLDINNKNKLIKIIKKFKPVAVFNLAAETHVDRSIDGPKEFVNTNLNGTFNLLESLRYLQKKKIKLDKTTSDAISSAASQVVKTVLAKAIFTYTTSGATAKRAARERPTVPIIGLSPERITARQLALIWGVHTIHALEPKSFSGMINNACELAKKEGIVKKGDYVVITAGAPIGVSGSTNNLRIAKIN